MSIIKNHNKMWTKLETKSNKICYNFLVYKYPYNDTPSARFL